MQRSDWRRVTKRAYACRPVEINGHSGAAGLLVLQELTAPLTITYPHGAVKIADRGYSWLQIALRDVRFWLTAMFDAEDRLIQIYFDITDGSHFDDPGNPWFEDMYLDVVTAPDGGLCVLDRDELEEALSQGDISSVQYEKALEDCAALQTYLETNLSSVCKCCIQLQKEMKRDARS